MTRDEVNQALRKQADKGSHEAKVLLEHRLRFKSNREQADASVEMVNRWAAQFGLKMPSR